MTLTEKHETVFPLDWCRREGLERGDPLNVFDLGKDGLLIRPVKAPGKRAVAGKFTNFGLVGCFKVLIAVCFASVKPMSFNEVKQQEAQSRMTAARKARRSPRAAAALQQRASLVGNGAKWRITNFKQVARAMSKWA